MAEKTIHYYNRHTGRVETEKIYGEAAVQWLYGSALGPLAGKLLCQKSWASKFYGLTQNLSWSKSKIAPFVERFAIKLEQFRPTEGRNQTDPYANFNEFFIRRFQEGARTFTQEQSKMPAFCEARYYGHDKIHQEQTIPVKGSFLRPRDLLKNKHWGTLFHEGPVLIARLCPCDYHRFHFPDDGKVLDIYPVEGKLDSVNPVALAKKKNIFLSNKRQVSILQTQNFGKLAYIEVGAICVGKIIQTSNAPTFKRGQEKGYFLFGGSTVILIGEPNAWTPDQDILENTAKGLETYIELGNPLATKSRLNRKMV